MKTRTEEYLREFDNLCHYLSTGLLGWGDFKYAIEELNKTVEIVSVALVSDDTNARVI